jgi:cell division protein FtsI/penicillin-binding protein 2
MGSSYFKTRIIFISIIFLVSLGVMITRFYYVQVVRHDELYGKAKREYTDVIKKKGKRGEIYDINGFLLAGNIPCTNIIADPQITGDNEQCMKSAELLAPKLKIPKEKIFKLLSTKTQPNGKPDRYALLKREVPLEIADQIKLMLKDQKCPGIYFRNKTKRYYPQGSLLAQTLGFINIDRDKEIAVSGIERATDTAVAGGEGKIIRERDRKGYTLSYGDCEIDETVNGKNIFLTIDEQIQTIVEDELDKMYAKFSPKAAYAVMINPKNGNIMAMAQRPTFDPNDRSTMKPGAWRNRMTTDVFEPGSTMKPVVISSALDNNIVTPNTKFDCEMGYWKDMKLRDSHHMGVDSVTRILAESSNIGTAKISIKMGKILLYQSMRRFGFGKETGIPLRPEATGSLRKPNRWDYLSISRFPIGQGMSVTPLQLARAYCALANGGYLVKLRLVDRIQDTTTGKFEKKKIETPNRVFMRDKSQKEIIEMMKLVTQKGGTATRAALKNYAVAGKTGTSQKWIPIDKINKIKGHYSESKFFATFVGFAPADKAAFVLAVIADEPQGNHYGGVVSAPTFREIARRTLAYLNIPPEK